LFLEDSGRKIPNYPSRQRRGELLFFLF